MYCTVLSGLRPQLYARKTLEQNTIQHHNDTMELVIYGARQFGIKTRRSRHFGNLSYGGLLTRGACETYLITLTDICSFLCVSGQRGTIAKSMYEENLCVVALTSIERGTQFFPLGSYFLV